MKLLWLSHFVPYPPTGHGALQRTHHLLKQASRRHEIHLIAFCPPSTLSPTAVTHAVRELSGFVASVDVFPLTSAGARLRRALLAATTFVRSATFWERWFWSHEAYDHVRRLARSKAFDLVHVDTLFLAPYLDAVPGVPIALNHHNVESQVLHGRAASERAPWRRLLFATEANKVASLERALVPRVAQNLVVSDLDGARLREVAPGARVTTVANGVDVDFFRVRGSRESESGTLIFAASMDWFPNRDAALYLLSEIWPMLVRDNPNRRMTVIGRAPPPALVDARDPRLRVLGFVDDVRPHVEAASIYVCPVRLGGGTRLKILDALAMSRPVVSTTLGVEGLGLLEEKHYVRANTPAEFVRQIARLEADPGLRQRLGEAGRAFVIQHYSWQRVAESLEQAYAEAARATERPRLTAISEAPAG